MRRVALASLLACAFWAAPARAQDPPHQHPSSDAWQWSVEGHVFAGYDYQYRDAFYTRAENLEKGILDAGFHPIGAAHTHRPSRVGIPERMSFNSRRP